MNPDTSIGKQLKSYAPGASLINNPSIDFELLNISRSVENSDKSSGLGKDANIVAKRQKNAKYERFRELSYAQTLLIQNDVKSKRSGNIHRTRMCHAARSYTAESISLNISADYVATSKASLSGLQTCGSVWSCPVCARRIAMQRGIEVSYTIDEMQKLGYVPIMLTLTASHTLIDRLDSFKTKFKTAWRKFAQSGTWQRLKKLFQIQHSIKAIEVTRTYENGWHYHQHGLLFIHADVLNSLSGDELENWQDKVKRLWLSTLSKCGLKGNYDHAAHFAAGNDVKENYLSKLGMSDETSDLDYELTAGANKDYAGRNIWAILRSAKDGNEEDAALYVEYVESMSGDNWITYSHGLKDLVNLEEMDAEQASAQDEDAVIYEKLMDITDEDYYFIRRTRTYAELLEVAAASRSVERVRDHIETLKRDYMTVFKQSDTERMKRQYEAIDKQLARYRESYNKKSYDAWKKKQSFMIDFEDYLPDIPELLRKWRELRDKLHIK